MTKKKNNPVDEPTQSTEKNSKIDDVLQASRTGHTKKLRKLILDKKMCSVEQLCSMTDEEMEEMVHKEYCCFYVRQFRHDVCDMDTIILIPRNIANDHAIIIER
jgi:hypothetical protein